MNREECLDIFEKYIQKEASPAEVERLRSYIYNDQGLNKWLEDQITHSSNDIDVDIKMRMLDNIRSCVNYQLPNGASYTEKPKNPFRWLTNIAAILLPIVLLIGAYMYLKPQEVSSLEIAANLGEKASMTLPDGSKVSINSDSKITYYNNYNSKNRILKLNGEAYFDVQPDPSKPFIVECYDLRIEVLGTTFGINAYEDNSTVSVVLNTGKIKLTSTSETIDMLPNDRVVYDKKTRKTRKEIVNASDYTDWRHNRLRFENESLGEIIKTLSRMHNIDIVLKDDEIAKSKFTGTIDNTNIEAALNIISLTSPIIYKVENSKIYLSEDKRKKEYFK